MLIWRKKCCFSRKKWLAFFAFVILPIQCWIHAILADHTGSNFVGAFACNLTWFWSLFRGSNGIHVDEVLSYCTSNFGGLHVDRILRLYHWPNCQKFNGNFRLLAHNLTESRGFLLVSTGFDLEACLPTQRPPIPWKFEYQWSFRQFPSWKRSWRSDRFTPWLHFLRFAGLLKTCKYLVFLPVDPICLRIDLFSNLMWNASTESLFWFESA